MASFSNPSGLDAGQNFGPNFQNTKVLLGYLAVGQYQNVPLFGGARRILRSENSNGVAINRNFPGAFERAASGSRPPVEPESASVLRLMRAHPALLTVLLFAGLRGVLYPYDDEPGAEFYKIGKFPGVSGCIDCTHVPIRSPGGDDAEVYRNRKGYFSINVQGITGPDLQFYDVVASWPGSAHDSRIFDSSRARVV
ncbi:hypothetical protein MTO96_028259 [Rhipicephalus appendiculatus]